MRRREFIAFVGTTAVAWPFAARAQQTGKVPTIGILGPNTLSVNNLRLGALTQRLREFGWIEGRTIAIEYRWAEGREDHAAEIAAEFVRLAVNVIVTWGTTSLENSDLASKRVALLREIVPGLSRLAIFGNVASPNVVLEMGETRTAARALGLEVVMSEIRRGDDITPAIEALRGSAEALYVCGDPLTTLYQIRINTLAHGARLPTMASYREFVASGGLMSYGPDYIDLFRRAADLVDKVLRGTNPANIPVEQPTKFSLIINLTTAKALGLTIPEAFLARADEIIE